METIIEEVACAACGKDGDGLKTCSECKLAKYCNATCQHKKECKKRAAALHDEALFKKTLSRAEDNAASADLSGAIGFLQQLNLGGAGARSSTGSGAETVGRGVTVNSSKDEALFKKPPPNDECPICLLTIPILAERSKYQACCGKLICYGCMYADREANNRDICPFCRTPPATSDGELIERYKKLVKNNNAVAMFQLGCYYRDGSKGLPQDREQAIQLLLRAGELGYARAYYMIAIAYFEGGGMFEQDKKKATYYWEIAAMTGDVQSRHQLGFLEYQAGNINRMTKHWIIAAGAGCDTSLDNVRRGFMVGHATKDDFEKALRTHKEAVDEMNSDQRDRVVNGSN